MLDVPTTSLALHAPHDVHVDLRDPCSNPLAKCEFDTQVRNHKEEKPDKPFALGPNAHIKVRSMEAKETCPMFPVGIIF